MTFLILFLTESHERIEEPTMLSVQIRSISIEGGDHSLWKISLS